MQAKVEAVWKASRGMCFLGRMVTEFLCSFFGYPDDRQHLFWISYCQFKYNPIKGTVALLTTETEATVYCLA